MTSPQSGIRRTNIIVCHATKETVIYEFWGC